MLAAARELLAREFRELQDADHGLDGVTVTLADDSGLSWQVHLNNTHVREAGPGLDELVLLIRFSRRHPHEPPRVYIPSGHSGLLQSFEDGSSSFSPVFDEIFVNQFTRDSWLPTTTFSDALRSVLEVVHRAPSLYHASDNTIGCLSHGLLVDLVLYLPLRDINSVMRTCKAMRDICDSERVWTELLLRRSPISDVLATFGRGIGPTRVLGPLRRWAWEGSRQAYKRASQMAARQSQALLKPIRAALLDQTRAILEDTFKLQVLSGAFGPLNEHFVHDHLATLRVVSDAGAFRFRHGQAELFFEPLGALADLQEQTWDGDPSQARRRQDAVSPFERQAAELAPGQGIDLQVASMNPDEAPAPSEQAPESAVPQRGQAGRASTSVGIGAAALPNDSRSTQREAVLGIVNASVERLLASVASEDGLDGGETPVIHASPRDGSTLGLDELSAAEISWLVQRIHDDLHLIRFQDHRAAAILRRRQYRAPNREALAARYATGVRRGRAEAANITLGEREDPDTGQTASALFLWTLSKLLCVFYRSQQEPVREYIRLVLAKQALALQYNRDVLALRASPAETLVKVAKFRSQVALRLRASVFNGSRVDAKDANGEWFGATLLRADVVDDDPWNDSGHGDSATAPRGGLADPEGLVGEGTADQQARQTHTTQAGPRELARLAAPPLGAAVAVNAFPEEAQPEQARDGLPSEAAAPAPHRRGWAGLGQAARGGQFWKIEFDGFSSRWNEVVAADAIFSRVALFRSHSQPPEPCRVATSDLLRADLLSFLDSSRRKRQRRSARLIEDFDLGTAKTAPEVTDMATPDGESFTSKPYTLVKLHSLGFPMIKFLVPADTVLSDVVKEYVTVCCTIAPEANAWACSRVLVFHLAHTLSTSADDIEEDFIRQRLHAIRGDAPGTAARFSRLHSCQVDLEQHTSKVFDMYRLVLEDVAASEAQSNGQTDATADQDARSNGSAHLVLEQIETLLHRGRELLGQPGPAERACQSSALALEEVSQVFGQNASLVDHFSKVCDLGLGKDACLELTFY